MTGTLVLSPNTGAGAGTPFAPITVQPNAVVYELLLTALTPVSHHDAAVQDDSNRTLFNRQKQLLAGAPAAVLPDQTQVDALCAAHPVPSDVAPVFADIAFPEFVAAALVRLFLDIYNGRNGGEGEGVFTGMDRYGRLEARLRQSAVGAHTLRSWWDRLCTSLVVSVHPQSYDATLLTLLSLPRGIQALVLRVLTDNYRSAVALGRIWHTTAKAQSPGYAERSGGTVASAATVTMAFDAAETAPGSASARVLEVPAVSSNSLRHQIVREPAWLHLAKYLGLREAEPGRGPLPAGAEALFYNGGNIRAGAKQPSDTFTLALKARALYPSLDLVGGVTDSFDLGESRLAVASWLVCRENAAALAGSPAADLPAATVSAFDLLDDVTLTRQAGESGVGQMIFSLESLAAGAQVVVRLVLKPFTPALTHGALAAAVSTYLANGAEIGGQAARGFGHMAGAWLTTARPARELQEQYEDYLVMRREELVAGLINGTLGTGKLVVS